MHLKALDWFKNMLATSPVRKSNDSAASRLSRSEMEFLPAALEIVETPPSPIGRAIVWVLISLFTIGVIWACIGHVDEVAVAPGKVIPSGYTKTIQAFDTSVVRNIPVKDGTRVQPGDVLIELDTTFTKADLSRLLKDQAYYKLEISRLVAEQSGQPFIPEPDTSVSPQDLQNQLLLYRVSVSEYQTKLSAVQQTINQYRAALNIAQSTKRKLEMQHEIAVDKEAKMKQLAEQGAVSQFLYQDYREKMLTLRQDLEAQTAEIEKAQHILTQSIETLNNMVSQHDKDLMTKLVNDRRQLQATEEELRKAEEKHRLSTITSPIAGTVQQLAVHTVGGVVTPAQPLMLIVPEGEQMEIEAWVANKDIGFVYQGQKAEIKVETFNFQKYGTLDAKLIEISSDAIDDKEKGLVYRAVLRTDADHFALANDRKVYLTPGMAVTAEIKTRQKRVIEYFLDPFVRYRSEGLRER